jgi:predicted naringenin-chalcone synthase
MQGLYTLDANDERKHELLYQRSGIQKRYSCVPDYDLSGSNKELYHEDTTINIAPTLEKRMGLYHRFVMPLALKAIDALLLQNLAYSKQDITHIITVSCTGMSAPGLDLQLMEALQLSNNVARTSINFMGCYAAVHGLKQAHAICESEPNANVLLVCVELCTLHFQKKSNYDNLTANAIFGDGAAAALICSKPKTDAAIEIKDFYSEVNFVGKNDMAWELSSTGFLMTLSSYIPQLLGSNINSLIENALHKYNTKIEEIQNWAIHPGGRKILEVISQQLNLEEHQLESSYKVLKNHGNMSSPTILFVLADMLLSKKGKTIGAAFGPGLTMETFIVNIL